MYHSFKSNIFHSIFLLRRTPRIFQLNECLQLANTKQKQDIPRWIRNTCHFHPLILNYVNGKRQTRQRTGSNYWFFTVRFSQWNDRLIRLIESEYSTLLQRESPDRALIWFSAGQNFRDKSGLWSFPVNYANQAEKNWKLFILHIQI